VKGDTSPFVLDPLNGFPLMESRPARLGGAPQCGHELLCADVTLRVNQQAGTGSRCGVRWTQVRPLCFEGRRACDVCDLIEAGPVARCFRELEGAAAPVFNSDTCGCLDARDEVVVQPEALDCQFLERTSSRSLDERRQYTGGSVRRPGTHLARLEHVHPSPPLRELERNGGPDDPRADNRNCHFSMIVRACAVPSRQSPTKRGHSTFR